MLPSSGCHWRTDIHNFIYFQLMRPFKSKWRFLKSSKKTIILNNVWTYISEAPYMQHSIRLLTLDDCHYFCDSNLKWKFGDLLFCFLSKTPPTSCFLSLFIEEIINLRNVDRNQTKGEHSQRMHCVLCHTVCNVMLLSASCLLAWGRGGKGCCPRLKTYHRACGRAGMCLNSPTGGLKLIFSSFMY